MKGNKGFKTDNHSSADQQMRSTLALVLAVGTPEDNHLPFSMPFMSFMLKAFSVRPGVDARGSHQVNGAG